LAYSINFPKEAELQDSLLAHSPTKNVPDHALVVGNPARPIGWMCICGERLSDDLKCLSCKKQYQQTEAGLCESLKP
jgi:hypothetical protein